MPSSLLCSIYSQSKYRCQIFASQILIQFCKIFSFPSRNLVLMYFICKLQRCEIQIDLNFFFKLWHYEKLTFWNHLTRNTVALFCGQKFPTKGRLKGFHSDKGSVEIRKSINLVCEDIGKTKIKFNSTDWYILLKPRKTILSRSFELKIKKKQCR